LSYKYLDSAAQTSHSNLRPDAEYRDIRISEKKD